MKKILFVAVIFVMAGFTAQAQNTMVVNTETIFTSMASYTDAMNTLDKLGQQYQKNVDDAYAEVEKMFNDYQSQRAYLSETARTAREDQIINREKEILEYQEKIFGQEGDLMKKRVELVKPIQDRVFGAINRYAETNGYSLVIDIASNPIVLYYSPSADKTQEIIRSLN